MNEGHKSRSVHIPTAEEARIAQRDSDAQDVLREWEHELQPNVVTGLPGRAFLERKLSSELGNIKKEFVEHREESPESDVVSVLFIDLNKFKQVNDTHGHAAGDEVLKRVADVLSETVRADDTVSHFGGDEFVILLPGTGKNGAEMVKNKIKEKIESNDDLKKSGIGLSIGSYSVDASNLADSKTILKYADAAMYTEKNNNKSRDGR